jgi:hypothetical protein
MSEYKFLLIFRFLCAEKIGRGKGGFCWGFLIFWVFVDGELWTDCGETCGKDGHWMSVSGELIFLHFFEVYFVGVVS